MNMQPDQKTQPQPQRAAELPLRSTPRKAKRASCLMSQRSEGESKCPDGWDGTPCRPQSVRLPLERPEVQPRPLPGRHGVPSLPSQRNFSTHLNATKTVLNSDKLHPLRSHTPTLSNRLYQRAVSGCNRLRLAAVACLLPLLILLAFAAVAQAQSTTGTTADGLVYSASNSQITITRYRGIGGTLNISNTINVYGTNLPVTSIGNSAFRSCTGLTGVTIPSSVTSIGNSAFDSCTGLTGVTIPGSVTSIGNSAFDNCTGLTSVTIPGSVTSIGSNAFSFCARLTSVTIPSSVSSIGYSPFSCCGDLISIIVDALNATYSSSVDGVLFDKNKTSLVQYPGGKSGSYTIPNSVASIGKYAFFGCLGLTSVTIRSSVTSIGDHAFDACTGLTSVTIPNSVSSIGNYAFNACFGLTSVTIPSSVSTIGDYAFEFCIHLTSITVDPLNAAYNSSADGVLFNKSKTSLIAYPGGKPGSYTIPSSVASIGRGAFYYCRGLTSVAIPSSVSSIGVDAFYYCDGLTSVTIPSSVSSIGDYAFDSCSGLTSVTIPSSVSSIGDSAFESCSGLANLYFQGDAPSLGSSVFSYTTLTVYYVAWTSGWGSTFGGRPTALWAGTGPRLIFNAPQDGATVTVPSVVVSGYASDSGFGDSGITSVTANGVSATDGSVAGSGTANWSATIPLVLGSNAISVAATDGTSGVLIRRLSVFYSPTSIPVVTTGVTSGMGGNSAIPMAAVAVPNALAPGAAVTYQGYSLNSSGGVAFAATLTGAGVAGGSVTGIWTAASGGGLLAVARTGGPAPGAPAGGVFSALADPAFNDLGRVAFVGTLGGAGAAGLKSGVWSYLGGVLSPLALSGNAAPKCPGAKFAGFSRVQLPNNGHTVVVGRLAQGGGVTSANNMGIWVGDTPKTMKLLIRKGQSISLGGQTKVVKGLSAFNASASEGDGFYMNNAGTLDFQAQFGDSSAGIFTASQSGRFTAVAWKNGVAPGIRGAKFVTLGNPVINDAGQTAFRATVKGPGLSAANNAGIWSRGKLVARTGVAIPGVGVFRALGNPVTNSLGGVAFQGTLTSGVVGIWWWQGGALRAVATTAMPAPDCNGALFQTFSHLVLPDAGGPLFQAGLAPGTGDANASNTVGLWAVGANGVLELVARQGQPVLDSLGSWRTVIAGPDFVGKPGSYTRLGEVIYKVTLDGGTQALYHAKLP